MLLMRESFSLWQVSSTDVGSFLGLNKIPKNKYQNKY